MHFNVAIKLVGRCTHWPAFRELKDEHKGDLWASFWDSHGGYNWAKLEEFLEVIDLEVVDLEVMDLEVVDLEMVNLGVVDMRVVNLWVVDLQVVNW